MSKNILILNGSPKKNGNTSYLVKWFVEGTSSKCAKIEIINTALPSFKSKGCLSCRKCQKNKRFECIINDDAKEVLKKMAMADVIVFATPLYFYGPSAQLKNIIDRMFSLYKWDNSTDTFETPMDGKTMILLLSAYEDIGLELVEKTFRLIADYSNMKFLSFLVPNARESAMIKNIKGIHKKATAFAKKTLFC